MKNIPWFVPTTYVYKPFSGKLRFYELNSIQKVFITLIDGKSSVLGILLQGLMRATIILNTVIYVVSWEPAMMVSPTSCSRPVCDNDPDLCDNEQICKPHMAITLMRVQVWCLVVYAVELLLRLISCCSVPARVAGVLLPLIPSTESISDPLSSVPDQAPSSAARGLSSSSSCGSLSNLPSPRNDHSTISHSLRPSSFFDLDRYTIDDDGNERSMAGAGRSKRHSGLFQIRGSEISVNVHWEAKEVLEGTIAEDPTYPWRVQLGRYMRRPNVVMDILAVLPLAICLAVYSNYDPDTVFLNVARIMQLTKLVQFQKNRRSVSVITRTVLMTYKTFLFMFWCILLVVLFVGAVVFALERGEYTVNDDYPDGAYLRSNVRHDGKEVSPFTSLGVSLYWVVVSVTTVGYGDLVPTTYASRAICSILFLLSILILSLPVSVIGEAFGKAMEQYNAEKKTRQRNVEKSLMMARPQEGNQRKALQLKNYAHNAGMDMDPVEGGHCTSNPIGCNTFNSYAKDDVEPSIGTDMVGEEDCQATREDRRCVAMTAVSRVPFHSSTSALPEESQTSAKSGEDTAATTAGINLVDIAWEISDALNTYRSCWDRCSRLQQQQWGPGRCPQLSREFWEAKDALAAAHLRMGALLAQHDQLLGNCTDKNAAGGVADDTEGSVCGR